MYGSFVKAGKELSVNKPYCRQNKVFESLCVKGQSGRLGAEPPAAGGHRGGVEAKLPPSSKIYIYFENVLLSIC